MTELPGSIKHVYESGNYAHDTVHKIGLANNLNIHFDT